MDQQSKHLTAFSTPSGLFQFTTMSFGLVNAPATLNKLMRKLLHGMNEVDNFIDDILISTDTWKDHLEVLTELFVRLQNARLTIEMFLCILQTRKSRTYHRPAETTT